MLEGMGPSPGLAFRRHKEQRRPGKYITGRSPRSLDLYSAWRMGFAILYYSLREELGLSGYRDNGDGLWWASASFAELDVYLH